MTGFRINTQTSISYTETKQITRKLGFEKSFATTVRKCNWESNQMSDFKAHIARITLSSTIDDLIKITFKSDKKVKISSEKQKLKKWSIHRFLLNK